MSAPAQSEPLKARINALLSCGDAATAARLLEEELARGESDELHYLLGNVRFKQGEMARAMEHYMAAVRLNPESPAKESLAMVRSILDFYNKDIYGQ